MTYLIQIDDEVREATAAEIDIIEKIQADALKREQAAQTEMAAAASAVAKLEAIGLTIEEIAALRG